MKSSLLWPKISIIIDFGMDFIIEIENLEFLNNS